MDNGSQKKFLILLRKMSLKEKIEVIDFIRYKVEKVFNEF